MELRYLNLREEVIKHASHLADPDYQARVWIRREYPAADYYDDLSLTFEVLEDLGALASPELAIGSYLQTSAEAKGLAELGGCLYRLFGRCGTDLTDAQYLGTPEWGEVMRKAAAARDLLVRVQPNP